jgi:ABC-2 type transport system ATP-binding protein
MSAAVEIVDVARRFGAVQALAGVDLLVEQGEFFGLLGPNGAGKTTLISIVAGLTRADRGTARVLGHDVVTDYRRARRLLGVVPQELVFDPFFTVRETLRIQSGYFGLRDNDAWIDEILHHLDLASKADANMRALSGGMKRRVLVGQALVHKPPVIVLDEPTAGVDVELRQALWKFIRSLNEDGHTIILDTLSGGGRSAVRQNRDAQGRKGRRARHHPEPAIELRGPDRAPHCRRLARGVARARPEARGFELPSVAGELRRAREPARGLA